MRLFGEKLTSKCLQMGKVGRFLPETGLVTLPPPLVAAAVVVVVVVVCIVLILCFQLD